MYVLRPQAPYGRGPVTPFPSAVSVPAAGKGTFDNGGSPLGSGGSRRRFCTGIFDGAGTGCSLLRQATTIVAATPATKTTVRVPRMTLPHSTPTQKRFLQSRQRKA